MPGFTGDRCQTGAFGKCYQQSIYLFIDFCLFFIFIFFCLTLRVLYIKDKMNIMVQKSRFGERKAPLAARKLVLNSHISEVLVVLISAI